MEPTQILSDEHRVIEVVLTSLERLTEAALSANRLNREDARQALDFIRSFADGCHHHKEEQLLFPALVQKGMPSEGGPVATMLHEHRQGRVCVAGMLKHLDAAAEGDRRAVAAFAEHAREYIELLRLHIRKEDNVLFPVTIKIMNVRERADLFRAFEAHAADPAASEVHGNCIRLAEMLADQYGVPKDALSLMTCTCNRE